MQPDINKPSEGFPQENVEAIGREIERLKGEERFREAEPKEIIKESLKVFHPASGARQGTASATDHGEEEMLPDYMKGEEEAVKAEVEGLLHMAIEQGIRKSIAEAKRHGAYVLDALHDALADKLYPILKEKHLI